MEGREREDATGSGDTDMGHITVGGEIKKEKEKGEREKEGGGR